MELATKAFEFISQNPLLAASIVMAIGWASPLLPHHGDSYVVERSGNLKAKIDHAKELGDRPELSDKINLVILDITRGAFIHRAIFRSRVDPEYERLRRERKNSK